ncbi:MAG: conserved membrane protein of unknown function [Promethearchaeota archaeon]|nr:MAG: conserved membrane protein of unknown function [Candidatus Lokiarchaeota archaeon]
MNLKERINNLSEKLLAEENVKRIMYSLMGIYISLLIVGHIVATLATGYTIWDNWISDLGGGKYTPAPYLYDIACIAAGLLSIPFVFYTEQFLIPDLKTTTRKKIRLAEAALVFGLMGSLSYIGVGIFSEDRNIFGLHGLTSELAFGGFTLNAFFIGLFIVRYETKIPKILGVYGIIGPLTFLILFVLVANPLFEWFLLFAILVWLIPFSISVFHKSE